MQKQKILKIIKSLREDIDFNIMANYILSTRGQLAEKNERHLASSIRDQFFQICSFSKIKYIDENRADLLYKKFNQKIEIKYLTDGFLFSPEKKIPREFINEIKLINTDSKEKIDFEDCKDTLILCCEPHSFSILSWSDLIEEELIDCSKPGQIVAKKVPRRLFYEIINHEEFHIVVEKFDLQKRKDTFLDSISKDFLKTYNYNLTQNPIAHKICKPMTNKDSEIMNIKKNGSTQRAFELILNHKHDDQITDEVIQKLFKDTGEEKSLKACANYIYSLRKAGKITLEKRKIKKGNRTYYGSIYFINKDYLKSKNKNKNIQSPNCEKNQIKDTPEEITRGQLAEKILKSDKLSEKEKNTLIYQIV